MPNCVVHVVIPKPRDPGRIGYFRRGDTKVNFVPELSRVARVGDFAEVAEAAATLLTRDSV